MMEKLANSSLPEELESELSFDDIDALLNGEILNSRDETLRQLDEVFANRIFRYKAYAGTVGHLASACPAFDEVLTMGLDYAIGWLEANDQPEGVTEQDDDNEVEIPEVEPKVGELQKDHSTESADSKSKPDTNKNDITTKEPMPAVNANDQVAAAVIPATLLTKARDTVAESPTVNADAMLVTSDRPIPKPEVVSEKTASAPDTGQERRQAEALIDIDEHIKEVAELNANSGDNAEELLIAAEVTEVSLPEIIEVSVEPSDLATDSHENKLLIDSSDNVPYDIRLENETSEHETEVSLPVVLPVEVEQVHTEDFFAVEEEPAEEPTEELVDEYDAVESDEPLNTNEYAIPVEVADINSAESVAPREVDEVIAQYDRDEEVLSTEVHQDAEASPVLEDVESFEAEDLPTQELIEYTVKLVGEAPQASVDYVYAEAADRVDATVRAIQALESAHTAKECHDALAGIKLELASLLKLLGYENAEAIAERVVRQYDTANLRQYLAQLVRILEARRSESTMTRQFKKPQSSRHRYGIHAVSKVVVFTGRLSQFAA